MLAQIEQLMPPLAMRVVRKLIRMARPEKPTALEPGFYGTFSSFQQALESSPKSFYQDPEFTSRFREFSNVALEKIKKEPLNIDTRSARLLAALLMVLKGKEEGRLKVLDFGGGLGLHYYALRTFLSAKKLDWEVIETSPMTTCGNSHFRNNELTFSTSLDGVGSPSIALASGSIQYLDDPLAVLRKILALTDSLILDRIPIVEFPNHVVTTQLLTNSIFEGCNPAWLFSRTQLEQDLENLGLKTLMKWKVPEDGANWQGQRVFYEGCLLVKKSSYSLL